MAFDTSLKRLLDDGEFYVALDPKSVLADDMAAVFLERRSIDNTPERIGSVHLQADESWLAAVAADPIATSKGFEVVAKSAARLDAIVALWQHRRDAFLGRHAL